MILRNVVDEWNENKVWVIKKYSDGHYYLNQEIKGVMFYKAFRRVTLKWIREIIPALQSEKIT